jgi:transcriptional regulator with XRE-family HTH domain
MSLEEIADAIDKHVGQRLRDTRILAGITQTELAQQLGVSFQQIQKYERGTNRISASKMYLISHVLNIQMTDLFQGLEQVLTTETGALKENHNEKFFVKFQNDIANLNAAERDTLYKIADLLAHHS